MGHYPLVSIVTPSYNQAEFLEETILSVLNQDYPNLEYIIMDGGSTDGSVDIIKKYASRLRYWVSGQDKGQSDAINKGWDMSGGKIIAYLNSDDTYAPGAIKQAVEIFLKHPQVHLVYGDMNFIDGDSNVFRKFEAPEFNIHTFIGDAYHTCYIRQPTTFFRRVVLDEIGMLDINMHYAFDYDFFIRICTRFPVYRLPSVLANFRHHKSSKTMSMNGSGRHDVFWPEKRALLESVAKDSRLSLKVRALAWRKIGICHYSYREMKSAKRMFIRALRTSPSILKDPRTYYFLAMSLLGSRVVNALSSAKKRFDAVITWRGCKTPSLLRRFVPSGDFAPRNDGKGMMSYLRKLKAYCQRVVLYIRLLFFRNKNRYCFWLWSTLYIRNDGDVYVCCHNEPGIIGNIHKQNLKEIWASRKLERYRKLCLEGRLMCMADCNLYPKDLVQKRDKRRSVTVPYEGLKRLWLLFGTKCNISCVMCPQDHDSGMILSNKVLLNNIDFKEIREIVVAGGEPMFMRECLDTCQYVMEKYGKKIDIVTNGTIMNPQWAENIAKHANFINISINAATKETHEKVNRGSNWERVLENVRLLQNVKKRLNSNLNVKGHMTIVVENIREIPLFIEKGKDLGFDSIDFGYDISTVPHWLKSHREERDEIKRLIRQKLNQSTIEVRPLRLQQLDLI